MSEKQQDVTIGAPAADAGRKRTRARAGAGARRDEDGEQQRSPGRNGASADSRRSAVGAAPDRPDTREVTADDIIGYQKSAPAASNARIQELQLSLNTVTNLAGCAMKFMVDKGYGDESTSRTRSRSRSSIWTR